MKLRSVMRSLSHRNYRLYFLGQSISLIGTWMQQVAMSWVVYQLTGSSFQLGLVLFCGQIPALFISPVAGVFVDRWNRRSLLLKTQSLAMVQAFILAWLDASGEIAVWQLLALSLFLGVVNAFDMTARQAFLTEIVTSRADIGNAIALNSSIMNGARLVGPSLAGIVLASAGAGVCFLCNGISYLAVLLALYDIRLTQEPKRYRKKLREGLVEGVKYTLGFAPIRVILLMLCVSSMAGSAYNVLLPELAVSRLHGGAQLLGILGTAAGLGALAGAIFLAARSSIVGIGKWIWIGSLLMGIGLLLLARPMPLWAAIPELILTGFGMMVQMAASNTLLQTISDEDKRGRVMSFYTMAFMGMAPLGSLFTGFLATASMRLAFTVNGTACLMAAVAFFSLLPVLRKDIRPIYMRMGLLSPLAVGIETASELKLMAKE